MKYSNIREARKANKGKAIVWYPFQLGGMPQDRGVWCSEKDGDVIDYNDKQVLVNNALRVGESVVVLTLHRDGSVSARQPHP
jgi:hypothetical protein